jgi:hypothetical protein
MTCIVGLFDEKENCVYIGGDSLGSNLYSKTVRLDRKVFKLKNTPNAILGYTSSYRMGQLLMYATDLIDELAIQKDKIDHEYLVTKFIPNIIKLFESGGYAKIDKGEKEGGEFLFAYKNKLYKIESDFQVGMSSDNYDACGCGEQFALGSLSTTEGTELSTVERIHKALQAASKFSCGVASPYYIINTKNDEVIEFKE